MDIILAWIREELILKFRKKLIFFLNKKSTMLDTIRSIKNENNELKAIIKKLERNKNEQEIIIRILKTEHTELNDSVNEAEELISHLEDKLYEQEEQQDIVNSKNIELQKSKNLVGILYREKSTRILHTIFNSLDLTNNERISIFIKSEENFILTASYCRNMKFQTYEINVVSLSDRMFKTTWESANGFSVDLDCPCPKSKPTESKEYLEKYYSISVDTERKMESCRFVSAAIDTDNDRRGILVCESTDTDFLNTSEKIAALRQTVNSNKPLLEELFYIGIKESLIKELPLTLIK